MIRPKTFHDPYPISKPIARFLLGVSAREHLLTNLSASNSLMLNNPTPEATSMEHAQVDQTNDKVHENHENHESNESHESNENHDQTKELLETAEVTTTVEAEAKMDLEE